jgi:hypothetical protein
MFEQGNNMGYGFPQQQMMYNGIQPQAMPKRNNVLTDEEIKKLQANRTQFTLSITEDEHLRAACNHRTADGTRDALTDDPLDPNVKVCAICGQRFVPIDPTSPREEVQAATDAVVNILQTIKIMYQDFPAEAARQYFDIIPLIGKIPQLFEYAVKNLAKYENTNGYGFQGASPSAMGLLNNFMGMMGSGGYGFAGAQPQYQQPQMQQQVYPGNPFGYPGASVPNYGYGQPQAGYMPQSAGFAYTPQATPEAPAPTPAAEESKTTTTNVQA